MNLNRKGYMLVEIIVSFVLAFSIAIYLFNLVIKFKDTNEDIFYSTKYLKDKNLITRNIMSDLENYNITSCTIEDTSISFEMGVNEYARGLTFLKKIVIDQENKTITYGELDYYTGDFRIDYDNSYYTKKLESSLLIGDIEDCSNLENGYFCVNIPITSMYDDNNYDIKLFSSNVVI